MEVRRQFGLRQRVGYFASCLSESKSSSLVKGYTAAQVGQRKGCLAVAAISGAKQREKRLVLINGQKLAIAHGPVSRIETKAKDFYFRQERL